MSPTFKVRLPSEEQADVRPPESDHAKATAEPQLDHLNVEQRLAYLREQFSPGTADEAPIAAGPQRKSVKSLAQNVVVRRTIKTAVAAAIAGLVVWSPAQRLFQTTSVEAVVNARTFTLRAPIDGIVSSAPTNLAVGSAFISGAPLLRITNSRADRSRVDDLRRLRERAESEVASLKTRLGNIERMHGKFVEQTRLFQKGRIAQLEARVEEGKANLSAAATRQAETAAALERAVALSTNGFQPVALLQKVERDNEIARQDARSIEQRIVGITVELESAKSGSFLGDSYNDRPRSSQRADELQQQIIELSAQLTEKQVTLSQLQKDFQAEQERYDLSSDAPVFAPSSGTIWELLTAAGEQVQRGQDLVRLLDCNAVLVTAVVSEAVYNRLQIGTAATFRSRGGGEAMSGRVVNLTGVASASANLAIAPSALTKEQYRVAVEIPELGADNQSCHVGRTGQVVFGDHIAPLVPALRQSLL